MSKYHGTPAGSRDLPQRGQSQVWYIVRDGKDLRIMREPGEWKVVRRVQGKMAAAQRELRRMQR